VFPEPVSRFGGDALYAVLMYCLVGVVRPIAAPARLFLWALSISVAVELSQLIGWQRLQTLRSSWLGAHVLGQGFRWTDLVSYVVGVSIAFVLDRWFQSWRRRNRSQAT
jgi:hypothetical protein